ncbi:MAG: TerD family protein [Abitibacteriaceae bacterium]|nr:TerD family protein [Abditibacteriaceae bacterium]MBV9863733.1 TerD family protein [Abditibacteriaceae bacterium]
MNNVIYLRRRHKVWLEAGKGHLPPGTVGAILKNIESLGYTFSAPLIERLQTLSLDQITEFHATLIGTLRALVGAHKAWEPMYPNFPQQVMAMDEEQLYVNAIIHYLTNALPMFEKKERVLLLDNVPSKIIELGTLEDFEAIFSDLAAAKTSLSQTDTNDMAWFVEHYGDGIYKLLPATIPLRENVALIGAQLMQHTTQAATFLEPQLKTATDVLRLAVALSDGDVSLSQSTKFKTFSRKQRRLLLSFLERCPNLTEDMLRWRGRWIRLGEKLHPGEWQQSFPQVYTAFDIVRNDKPFSTFNRRLEGAVDDRNAATMLSLLQQRPGDFVRRLDHLLRLDSLHQDKVLEHFKAVAARVATPVLLQVLAHFHHRNAGQSIRTFFPKGNVAKVQAIKNTLPPLSEATCMAVTEICEQTLVEHFSSLPPLGKCFLDVRLKDFPVPFSQRSASKPLRTLVRGSKLALPPAKTLRFFIWWKDGRERTDIDLSAVLYDAQFQYQDVLSYYNLKSFGGHHSGDIVSAPQGAAEFIDVSLEALRAKSIRYVVMSVNSYTQQPFCDLPECFAGWMARTHPDSGEIFDPKTVQDRIDLAADTRICLPLIMDVVKEQVIWTDIALKHYPSFNNVHNNLGGVSLMVQAMTSLVKPSLFDLFTLHIRARGELVDTPVVASTVFSLDNGITPFDTANIMAQWL